MNRVGLALPSTIQQITWSNNQKIQITLPARVAGEDIHRILIAGAASNSAALLQPLAWWRGYTLTPLGDGYFEEAAATLPATIELTHNNHLALGATVADPPALAALTNLIDGMNRWVTSLAQMFYYDAASAADANGTTVIASSGAGRWLPWIFPANFGVGSITDITGQRGAWRDMRSLTDAEVLFPPPAYAMNGNRGNWVNYWVANGTTESGTNIPAGQRISLEVSQNGFPKSQLFDKRLVAKVLGVVRLSNGTLSTSGITTAQTDYAYGQPVYTLEQDLAPGYAIALQVAPRFRQEELDGYLIASPVEIKPYIMPQSGTYVTGYRLWGDVIYPLGDRRRVFPKVGATVRIGGGSGLVQRFEFELKAAQDLALGGTNLVNQKITVNSNGDVFNRGTATNEATEVTRAIVTMASGRSNASTQSAYLAATLNAALSVTVAYPSAIRSDYGDVIAGAGSSQGAALNAPFVVLYVQRQSDSQIREFVGNAVVPGASQVFTIASFTAGTLIGSIPAAVAGNFGFWASSAAPTVAANAGAGTLAADSYRVSWAFRYDGSTASSISHATANGCVPELDQPVSSLFSQVATLTATLAGLQNGTATLDALNLIARGAVDFWDNDIDLNADAAASGADWKYTIRRPSTGMSAAQILTLPPTAGQDSQALIGDGAGALQYASVELDQLFTLAFGSAASNNWFTLPANGVLMALEFLLIASWNGTSPTVAVGISGNSTKYLSTSDVNLKASPDLFLFRHSNAAPGSSESIIVAYTQSSASTGSARILARYTR
jgi:hypothetical protein